MARVTKSDLATLISSFDTFATRQPSSRETSWIREDVTMQPDGHFRITFFIHYYATTPDPAGILTAIRTWTSIAAYVTGFSREKASPSGLGKSYNYIEATVLDDA